MKVDTEPKQWDYKTKCWFKNTANTDVYLFDKVSQGFVVSNDPIIIIVLNS